MDNRLKPYYYLWNKIPKSIKLALETIFIIGILYRIFQIIKYYAGF